MIGILSYGIDMVLIYHPPIKICMKGHLSVTIVFLEQFSKWEQGG